MNKQTLEIIQKVLMVAGVAVSVGTAIVNGKLTDIKLEELVNKAPK